MLEVPAAVRLVYVHLTGREGLRGHIDGQRGGHVWHEIEPNPMSIALVRKLRSISLRREHMHQCMFLVRCLGPARGWRSASGLAVSARVP